MSTPTLPAKKLSVLKKLLFTAVTLALVGVAFELLLAIAGVRTGTNADPYVGFSSYSPVMRPIRDESGETILHTEPNKLVWFNHQTFPLKKTAGVRRIVCVGGSTT